MEQEDGSDDQKRLENAVAESRVAIARLEEAIRRGADINSESMLSMIDKLSEDARNILRELEDER